MKIGRQTPPAVRPPSDYEDEVSIIFHQISGKGHHPHKEAIAKKSAKFCKSWGKVIPASFGVFMV